MCCHLSRHTRRAQSRCVRVCVSVYMHVLYIYMHFPVVRTRTQLKRAAAPARASELGCRSRQSVAQSVAGATSHGATANLLSWPPTKYILRGTWSSSYVKLCTIRRAMSVSRWSEARQGRASLRWCPKACSRHCCSSRHRGCATEPARRSESSGGTFRPEPPLTPPHDRRAGQIYSMGALYR